MYKTVRHLWSTERQKEALNVFSYNRIFYRFYLSLRNTIDTFCSILSDRHNLCKRKAGELTRRMWGRYDSDDDDDRETKRRRSNGGDVCNSRIIIIIILL